MKAKLQALAFVSTLALAGAAQAQECSSPSAPNIPDGASATEQEMIAAKEAVETFIQASETYLGCVEEAEKAALKAALEQEEELPPEERNVYIEQYNTAVDSMKAVAADFNTELKAYLDTNR